MDSRDGVLTTATRRPAYDPILEPIGLDQG